MFTPAVRTPLLLLLLLHPARPGCCMECALPWGKALGLTLAQQGGATSAGFSGSAVLG